MVSIVKVIVFLVIFLYQLVTSSSGLLYRGYYLLHQNVTEFWLPLWLHENDSNTLCASVQNSLIVCLHDRATYIQIPGQYKEHCNLDVVSYAKITNQSSEQETQLINRHSLSYFIQTMSKQPIYREASVEVLFPPYASIRTGGKLVLQVATNADLDYTYTFSVAGLSESTHPSTTTVIESFTDWPIEPGSWFFTLAPSTAVYTLSAEGAVTGTGEAHGYPAHGYIEFALSDMDIARFRRFRTDSDLTEESRYAVPPPPPRQQSAPIMVCIWSSSTMDGQRRVWLQQSEYMDTARFSFTWIIDAYGGGDGTLRRTIEGLNVTRGNLFALASPSLEVQLSDLQQVPEDGSQSAAQLWAGNVTYLYLYAHQRLLAANSSIDLVSPLWCRAFYQRMREAFGKPGCDVAVYGNDRHFSSNVLITGAAAALGVVSVAELTNHVLHQLSLPDIIVAPSLFSVEQETVQVALGAAEQRAEWQQQCSQPLRESTVAVVIPPAVDTEVFRPFTAAEPLQSHSQHPACRNIGKPAVASPCLVVGFVARLSPGTAPPMYCFCFSPCIYPLPVLSFLYAEKNPGLFLQMAQRLLQLHPFARFTVVGDGALRAALEELVARLRISWAVHFTGWVSAEELPAVLASMDIVVNPGLVLETFCISNIEAMSMGVPLVTFAVGGIGEYVAEPPQLSADQHREGDDVDFLVSANAVVVHRAVPEALTRAVLHLLHRPALRRELGAAGRRTVLARFTVQRQMQQYSDMYQHIVTVGSKRC